MTKYRLATVVTSTAETAADTDTLATLVSFVKLRNVLRQDIGELADLYNRLRRAIQRWCVDACSECGWEIPFPQMTLHGALTSTDLPGV